MSMGWQSVRRLSRRDLIALAVLLPLWAACFGLEFRAVLSPVGFPPVFVAAAKEVAGYPTLSGFLAQGRGRASGLQVGDRLLRLAAQDLQGVTSMGFFARFTGAARVDPQVPIEFERAGVRGHTTLEAWSIFVLLPLLPASLIFALASVLMLLRGGPSPMIRAWFLVFMCLAMFLAATFLGSEIQTYAAMTTHAITMMLIGPLTLRALLRFPHGTEPHGMLARFGPWSLVVLGPLHMTRFGFPLPPRVALPGVLVGVAAFLVAALVIVTRTYRRVDAIGRRQMRWFLFGVYCGIAPALVTATVAAVYPVWTPAYFASLSALACIPIAMLVSVARYNLFDIDQLISATASYNAVVVLVVAAGLLIVPTTSIAAASLVGLEPRIGQLVFSLIVAALIVPLQRRLRPNVERLFFTERYALEQGIERLSHEIAGCPDLHTLTQTLGATLSTVLRPESCVIYGRSGRDYLPLFARGSPVLPALEADGPIVATLREHASPLAIAALSPRERPRTSPFHRAVLETLAAAVVVPVGHSGSPILVLCLGPKRSGDLYTPTDLRLLGLVARQAGIQLQRFGDIDVVRQTQLVQQALRRYVPRTLAEGLESGQHPSGGEYHVSILFVDLRGFTTYSEGRPLEHVVAVVKQYTETMSQLIRERGGTLVEFLGDGMMAVFGAPQLVPAKERAAIETARRMIEAVRAIPTGEQGPILSVGVGVATGRAFVGDIRTVERLIWTAIGDVANLAARLQALTRELDAAIAIDSTTYAAAGAAAADFEARHDLRIRGRQQAEDVYILPLARAVSAPGVARDISRLHSSMTGS